MAIVFVLRAFHMDDSALAEQRLLRLPIRIGRNPLADFRLRHPYVSDFHALIEDIGGRLCVRDLNSRNGVYVRGPSGPAEKIAPQGSVDLAAFGFRFFLGAHLRVGIEFEQMAAPASARSSSFAGTVLGNQAMLGIGSDSGGRSPLQLDPGALLGAAPGRSRSGPPQADPWDLKSRLPFPGAGSLPALPQDLMAARRQDSLPPLGSGAFEPAPAVSRNAFEAPGNALASTGLLNNLSLDQMALQGLRELAQSLTPGKTLTTTGDLARFITKLHDTVEVFCRCFIPLREGYAQFVSSLDLQRAALQRSVMRSPSYLAADAAREPAALAAALLDWRDRSMDAPNAIEEIFADLMIHQVALLDSVMQGVRGLLEQLSPDNIEGQVELDAHPRFALDRSKARYKALWETYSALYEQLAEEKQAFSHIFGPQFTNAYREYRRQREE
ncbi:MAG: type VI secretion system-associated FHA domain protein [Pseudomonadota bacterium]